MPKIFVSHSSKDKKLVDQIILFLESSLNLEGDSIRCSSSTGYSLPSGAQIELSIKSDIEEAELIIGVITNASRTSEWVQAELSAAWGKNKWIVPICAGIQSSKLMEPIKGLKIVRIEVEDDLIELIEKIEERLHLGRKSGSKVTVAARRLIEYFKTESMTQNIGQQFFSKFRQKYKLTKFVMLVGIIALSLALIGGYRLWEFVFKKQIIVGVGPHHTISKDDLKKSYKQRYHTSTLSRYELEFLVLDSYPDMLLDLLRQRVDVALVSPNTWIQFKTDKLLLKDDKGNKVKPADFWVLGQKRQKRGEDEVLKEYYQSCFLFKKGDHVLELAKKQNVSDGHLWNAIDANSIRGRTIFLNEETLSTSTFIIPFISLIEKGIVSDELCNMLEPCSRTGMVFQVTSSQSIGVGALSDEEIEQGRYERDIEKVIIPAKIPYDAVLVTLDKWRNWKETNKESFFREMLHDANLISIAGDQYAYDIFIERISSAVIVNVRILDKDKELRGNQKAEFDIWVPGPLVSSCLAKGFNYIDLDIKGIRAYFKTLPPKLEIVSFKDGTTNNAFDTILSSVCNISPISIELDNARSDVMTIRFPINQLPQELQKSLEKLVGYHIRKPG